MYKTYIKNTTQKTRKRVYNLLLIGPILLVVGFTLYNANVFDLLNGKEDMPIEPPVLSELPEDSGEEEPFIEEDYEHGFSEMTIKEHVEFWRDSLVSLTPLLVSLLAFLGRRKVVGDK